MSCSMNPQFGAAMPPVPTSAGQPAAAPAPAPAISQQPPVPAAPMPAPAFGNGGENLDISA